jgi:CMP-N-acetylneuraminic acid synthetase
MRVVGSTDRPDMYAHALAKGALDIGLRPAHLATDDATGSLAARARWAEGRRQG